ncbi:hypothetical protein [Ensifer adhaerens]
MDLTTLSQLPLPIRNKISATFRLLEKSNSSSLQEFVYDTPEDSKDYQLVSSTISSVATIIKRYLQSHDMYVGTSLIEEEVFDLVRAGADDPVLDFLKLIEVRQLHGAGFLLFPVHSYGVLGHGIGSVFVDTVPHLIIPESGLALTPQLNTFEKVGAFLQNAVEHLGIGGKLNLDDLRKMCVHPALKWVMKNPLLVLRIRTLTGTVYENQSTYLRKLSLATCQIMMCSTVAAARANAPKPITSTSRVNNYETLDINHYLVFENTGPEEYLELLRVPRNVGVKELAQLSDLAVELDVTAWEDSSIVEPLQEVGVSIGKLDQYQRTHVVPGRKLDARGRLAEKLAHALFWFRRSFNSSHDIREAIVSLAVAFEALLSDGYAQGVTNKILERAATCIGNLPEAITENKALRDLFDARGSIVHQGSTSDDVDMLIARRAFVRSFVWITERLDAVPSKSDSPLAGIFSGHNG